MKIEPKKGAIILIYILALGISIGINYWASNNEIREEDKGRYNKRTNYRR